MGGVAGADVGIIDAPYGLDALPENKTCFAPKRPAGTSSVELSPLYSELTLDDPMQVAWVPGLASKFFVIERGGVVKLVTVSGGSASAAEMADVSSKLSAATAETGLLAIAVHPSYSTNRQVFLAYSVPHEAGVGVVVRRYLVANDGKSIDLDTEKTVLGPFAHASTGAVAANLAFGVDGSLFVALGESGSTPGAAADPASRLGKLLRVTVNADGSASAPATNPFAKGGGAPEVFAWGFRRPERFSVDPFTGELWVADVGKARQEISEVDLGGDYGWPVLDGTQCVGGGDCSRASVAPLFAYDAAAGSRIVGGFVYRGSKLKNLNGVYVFGDRVSGKIWALRHDADGGFVPELLNPDGPTVKIVSFAETPTREIVAVTESGDLFALGQGDGDPGTSLPVLLSQTGCVERTNPSTAAAGLVPYDVIAGAWNDGVRVTRHFALPSGKPFAVAEGRLVLPPGGVLTQTFSREDRVLETRYLFRYEDGTWGAHSYVWNDAQTDAVLTEGGTRKSFDSFEWRVPSTRECTACHNSVSAVSLGLTLAQMNRAVVYPTRRRSNQLDTLEHVGALELPKPSDEIEPLPDPRSNAWQLAPRARAYLDVNCATCHQPGRASTLDLRYGTSFADTKLCNVQPAFGDLGINGSVLVAPGNPGKSLLLRRMNTRGIHRMPPFGTEKTDDRMVSLMDEWISALDACP
jgi:uncharacterized repeat protein (TIGR03806 family)